MTTTMLLFVTASIAGSLGLLAGWYLGRRSGRQELAAAELPSAMRRIVDMESVEKAQRLRKAEMIAAKRRSVPRERAVGTARISKVRFNRP